MSALTAQKEKVHVVVDIKFFYIWRGDDHVRVATELLSFGLDVAEGSRHRESAWKDSIRPVNNIWILFTLLLIASQDCTIVLPRLVRYGLN
jgi:hypothetical protein